MNPDQGGQDSDVARRTAAAIARRKVLAAYANAAKKAERAEIDAARASIKKNDQVANASSLKAEPNGAGRIDARSWQKYHSAWQNYYQKYYSEYYSKAAKDYVERERLKDARVLEEERQVLATKKLPEETPASADSSSKLRTKIRLKAAEEGRKSKRYRKLIPVFVGLFVVLFILFLQYNRLIFAPIMAYVSPGDSPASEIEAIDPTVTTTVSADPKLIIPKLNIEVPVSFGVSLDEVMSAMNHGVAQYRIAGASAYPGELGNLVITGHSAGDVYSSNQYKYIFSGLDRLDAGDLIYVNYNSTRYTYQVTSKKIIDPTEVSELVLGKDKAYITLVTCYPVGTSRQRLLVFGELISPGSESSAAEDVETEDDSSDSSLPSNEPTFFENIWNFLTGN